MLNFFPAYAYLSYSLLACTALVLSVGYLLRIKPRSALPPGPPGRWVLGNSIPTTDAFLQFEEWTQQYGPLFSLRQGNCSLVIIGRHQAAVEIMEKEGAHLVDRPRFIAAGETLSGGMRVLVTPSGPRFKRMRRALHAHLQPKMASTYESMQLRNARNLVIDILTHPDEHKMHAMRYAASVIMTLTYGKTTPTSYSDPEVQEVNSCLQRLGAVIRPGTYLVDVYPLLAFVPGYLSGLKRDHRIELSLFRRQLEAVKRKMESRVDIPACFAKNLLDEQAVSGLSDDEIAYLAGSMFGAGSDTTASGISFTVMAAACHPTAQRKAQAELDLVVGSDRYPTFDDYSKLPQVVAFALEVARWRPVSIGGFPHKATRDLVWQEYVIPAGSTVIANHWCISRDPEVFPDPDVFNPQRWLVTVEGEDLVINPSMKAYSFGFGRRVCPGYHVAERSLFITTALLLWAFKIAQTEEAPINTMAFTQSANVHPLPFKVAFEPRIKNAEDLLNHDI